jgi:hypothetical protein
MVGMGRAITLNTLKPNVCGFIEESEQAYPSSKGIQQFLGEYLGFVCEIEGPEEIFE